MKGIRQRGNSWVVDVTVNGKRKTLTCPTKEEAIAKRQALLSTMEVYADRPDQSTWTLQTAFERTHSAHWRGSRNEATVVINARDALEFFGSATLVTRITTDWLDEYVEMLQDKGLAPATINRKLAAISKMLSVAHERGMLDRLPHIPRRKERNGRLRFLSFKEEEALIMQAQFLGHEKEADIWMVLIDTGLRVGELKALEWRDVDLEKGTISIWENKADHPRTIGMTARAKRILMKLHIHRDPLAVRFDYFHLRYVLRKVALQAGVHDVTIHTFRHTCASRMVQGGVDLYRVQKWLGHKQITMTARYAHLRTEDLASCASVLEAGAA